MGTTNLEIVRLFCEALADGDTSKMGKYLSEDVLYHNLPWEPMTGAENVCSFCNPSSTGRIARSPKW